MSEITIRILSRSDRELATVTLPSTATLTDLKAAFYKQSRKHSPDRQYFTIGKDADRVAVPADKQLSTLPLPSPAVLYFKDLGPQIGWQTVFHVEYAGPIIMHAICYYLGAYIYPHSKRAQTHTYTQTVAFYLVLLHYLKREFETAFIHRFSNGTMPAFNIFKNSFHYWIIGGISIAYFLYHPQYTEVFSPVFVNIFAALFVLFELGNLYSHIILMNLRPPGTRVRAVPNGFLFQYVSCANYTFELLAWLVFSIMTQTLTAYIFLLVSTVQIVEWSAKKHKALRKEFGKDGIKPYALIPFVW